MNYSKMSDKELLELAKKNNIIFAEEVSKEKHSNSNRESVVRVHNSAPISKDIYVKKIKYNDTKKWLLNIHYAGRMPQISNAFGLFNSKTMIGVCTFGQPASPNVCKGICGIKFRKYVLELNRLVIMKDLPKNTLSFFVSRCLKLIEKPRIIVSYSDTGMNHSGYIYQALNFLYTGCGKKRTHVQGKNGKHPRHYGEDFTKRVVWFPKHRYILFLGNKKEKKLFKNNLKYKILPYPKDENKRYKIDFNLLNKEDVDKSQNIEKTIDWD